jgi:hypothetical protein
MSDKKEMSELEIASKIKAGKTFAVPDEPARKKALACAKFFGANIVTRSNGSGFDVFFVIR